MLDEMDKLGASFHGDPSSALLEVLDPEQNPTFRDNYLAVPFDLSHVMFVGTANVLDPIPGPLRDRMEVIELPGYTEDEKVDIAKRYLVQRQLDANGLTAEKASITDEALRTIVRDYTREAGVRNLERGSAASSATSPCGSPRAAWSGSRSSRRACTRSWAPGRSRTRWRSAPACRAWRPASPGPRSAATSCSSRPPGYQAAAA